MKISSELYDEALKLNNEIKTQINEENFINYQEKFNLIMCAKFIELEKKYDRRNKRNRIGKR